MSPSAGAVVTAGLSKTYPGGAHAVISLDAVVAAGEVLGLLGPNGAGKTTTVGMLTTRVRPSAGRAWVGGRDLRADPVGVKRAIGVVSQTNTLDRALTVRENLLAHGWYFGLTGTQARGAARVLLEAFRLAEWSSRPVRELSGGMAQRLMLARAVLHRPVVLFLDEPTTGLDPQSRIAAWDLLEGLHRAGQTILLTTHAMAEAERLCDRIAIMDHGTLLALGTPRELKAAHGGAAQVRVAVRGDAGAFASLLCERLTAVLAGPPVAMPADGSVTVPVRVAGGALHEVLRIAEEDRTELTDVAVARPDLERVFLNLTGRSLRE